VCTHQLPAGVTRLHARLAQVNQNDFAHFFLKGVEVCVRGARERGAVSVGRERKEAGAGGTCAGP
jgi:hypothetical protein